MLYILNFNQLYLLNNFKKQRLDERDHNFNKSFFENNIVPEIYNIKSWNRSKV